MGEQVMIELFVLVAIAKTDRMEYNPAQQTIGYYATAAECQTDKNRIEYNRDYVYLDCVPIKGNVNEDVFK
jgi:hypothetical protein